MRPLASFVAASLLLCACGGTSVADICNRIAECDGSDASECIEEGEQVEQVADDVGCGGEFGDFLNCLDDNFECTDGEPSGDDDCEDILEGCGE